MLHCSNKLRYHWHVWEPSALNDRLYRKWIHWLWENCHYPETVDELRKAVSPLGTPDWAKRLALRMSYLSGADRELVP